MWFLLSLLTYLLPVSRSICVAQNQNTNWQPNSKQTSPSIYPARCLRSLSELPAVCAALSLFLSLSLSVIASPPPAPGQQFNWNAHVINSEVVLPAILPHCVFECLPFAPTPILQASSFISSSAPRARERQGERENEALNKLRAGTKFLGKIIVITPKSFIINFNVWQQTARRRSRSCRKGRHDSCSGGEGRKGEGTLCMLRDVVRRGGDQPIWTRAVRSALPLMHPIATRLEIRGERECVTWLTPTHTRKHTDTYTHIHSGSCTPGPAYF